jgi:glycosyltransferase involved in cell wall biosynthesis
VTVLDEVPYGEPFLNLLRGFDAVVVPSLSDEQPRITYDAFSQAVPVLGSATGGIREVVESGVDGRLTSPGDVGALAESIIWAAGNRSELRRMGLRGLAKVRGATHREMHRNRHALLRRIMDGRLTTEGKGSTMVPGRPRILTSWVSRPDHV